MKKIFLLILILTSITNASAVEIYGKVYRWDILDVVDNVVVKIKDDTVQRMVSENGEYRFNVTPGNYTIIAYAGEYYAIENVTVESSMRFDLILFPKLEDVEEIPDFPVVEEEEEEFPYYIIAISASGFVLAVLFIIKIRSGKQTSAVEREIKPTEYNLPEDLAEVVDLIAKEGGRITQKELRKRLGYSEAKMSLIIADLERRGIVEKVKKGRGNIIFLKEKP